jgi:hypothetical protein
MVLYVITHMDMFSRHIISSSSSFWNRTSDFSYVKEGFDSLFSILRVTNNYKDLIYEVSEIGSS